MSAPRHPPEKVRRAGAAATVRFLEKDGAHRGQGVLVPGPWILSAAHVVHWDHTGAMAGSFNEREFLQEITVAGGSRFRVYPQAVEPVHDLAVLGAVDGQWLPHDDDASSPTPGRGFVAVCGRSCRRPPVSCWRRRR